MTSALRRKELLGESEEMSQLVITPSATMTGMSTLIGREAEVNDARRHSSALGGERRGSKLNNLSRPTWTRFVNRSAEVGFEEK